MQRSIGITRNIQTIEMKLSLSLLILVLVMVIIDHVHAEPFDISRVWFQHTNQIVHVYDQLSRSGTNRTEQVDNKAIQVEQCRSSMRQLVQDAKQGQYYANKMIDSIGRPTSGILEGRLTYLGQYDECIATKGENFVGKYCIAHIQLPRNVSQTLAKISGISSSLYQNLPVKLGVCLPSTCSTEDVNTIAQQFSQMFEPALSVRVVECMENDSNQSQTLHYVSFGIFCGICSVLCLFVLVATIFEYFSRHFHCSQSQLILNSKHLEPKTDYQTETLSIKRQLLLAFSVRENLKKIFTVSTTSSDSIGVFHGIKFIAMIWIIFSHSISFSSQWMNFNNPLDIRKTSHNLFSQVIVNGTFSVDCFFFISGYLVTHILLKHLQQTNDKLNLSLFYLKRYLRMTPTMMVTIGFGATLLRYFGSGPEWTNSTAMFDSWCRSNWWVNSLYIHNFVHIDNMCLSHSWYSAVDTQFYMISPFLVMLLSRRPGLGVGLCVFLLTSSVGITWVLTILNNYPAVPYFNDIM
ncbi:hypothetical protein RDWZM_001884 [Blomia tropicalis]|uniref:Nose resistant-to-fluoxetine protein N-terminal domain-containing protein n=1 Tax=Blomia tropicalis TaxID=40697 RepID=A0A9Q0MD97_BLOTA|nr:hypothetical protein RDWZM_001884 [Blomia tropicalis]